MSKISNWFYTTKLGELYFEILLWFDRKIDRPKYLTPKEVAQVIRQYSLLDEGIGEVKKQINTLVRARTKEEYEEALKTIEDLAVYAERKGNDAKTQYANFLKEACVKKGTVDISTALDRAKMVEQRIADYKELQAHIEKRNALREARKQNGKRN